MKEKETVLEFEINIKEIEKVKGESGEVLLITFGGTSNCKNFKGIVLSGAVDTQIINYGVEHTLSARYILEGIDCEGQECRIFVENNGTVLNHKVETTLPKIITDSKALAFLETERLVGTLTPSENGVIIHIYLE